MTDPTVNRIHLTLQSTLDSVELVEELAEMFARRAGFDEDSASQIAMVSREATVNAVVHGNKYDPAKQVKVSFAINGDTFRIHIADQGSGVDADNLPDPVAPENLMKTSGRGIFLMRAIMDEVHFHMLTPGTEIEMVKHRDQKEIHP